MILSISNDASYFIIDLLKIEHMNNTLENALVASAILAIFVLPVVILAQRAKRRGKTALITTLELEARKQASQLTRFDLLDNKIIGWAPEPQKVLFLLCYRS